MKKKCQGRELLTCLNCGKKFTVNRSDTVIYLCATCYSKFRLLPKGIKSKLALIGRCQDLGIIYIAD